VEAKLYALLDSKVGYVIGGLKQRRTKNRVFPTNVTWNLTNLGGDDGHSIPDI
jgi:hypothetical protein